jgi:hypothetical protein
LAVQAVLAVLVAEEEAVVAALLTALTLALAVLVVLGTHEFTVGKGIIWATQK